MNALGFAWRSLVRQPARATLGMLGVAAVGALLFDMLLLSQGLIVSMRDLLDRPAGTCASATSELPGRGRRVLARRRTRRSASRRCRRSRPRSSSASPTHESSAAGGTPIAATFEGVSGRSTNGAPITPPWTVMRGRDATRPERSRDRPARSRRRRTSSVGGTVTLRASCVSDVEALPPAQLQVVRHRGVSVRGHERGRGRRLARRAQGGVRRQRRRRSRPDAGRRRRANATRDGGRHSRGACPDCSRMTNDEVVGRLQQTGFTYFRQISTVLTTVTLVVRGAADHGAADRVGQPAARRDRRAARARLLARARGRRRAVASRR